MFSMQSVSKNPLKAAFQLLSVASLNLGQSQNGVSGNGLNILQTGFALALKKLWPNEKSWGQPMNSWGQILRSWGQLNKLYLGKVEDTKEMKVQEF